VNHVATTNEPPSAESVRIRAERFGVTERTQRENNARAYRLQTLGVISIRALGVRSSYKGRTVDASAMRGDEGRGQLRKASGSR
jgi:hypothetical protein